MKFKENMKVEIVRRHIVVWEAAHHDTVNMKQ